MQELHNEQVLEIRDLLVSSRKSNREKANRLLMPSGLQDWNDGQELPVFDIDEILRNITA